ncbi:hypothetical protein M569_14461 [Genlisea aurea]|uniref:Pentatricopeptide repeat-containing protein n=1 Tax=Genlisea aurea TaxID=192259 RepID=S8C7M5_9LAMI|nr:hypothetical protein M569_14461 [Genlisea aurea]
MRPPWILSFEGCKGGCRDGFAFKAGRKENAVGMLKLHSIFRFRDSLLKKSATAAAFHSSSVASNHVPAATTMTKLIGSYLEMFRLDEALKLFDEMPVKDVVVWNLMIKGCVRCGYLNMALKMFDEMPERNVVSWTTIIAAFMKLGMIEEAKEWFRNMPVRDTAAWNAVIHGAFSNGRVEEAMEFFALMPNRNAISWTTVISGLDRHGKSEEAMPIFAAMLKSEAIPTASTFSCVVAACANLGDLDLGTELHGHVFKLGHVSDPYIATSLITLYANCRRIDECVKAFEEKLHLDIVVWTSLLTGYSVNAKHEEALRLFRDMFRLGILPNQSSFTSALASTCEMEGSINGGRAIHAAAVKTGLVADSFVGNSLVVLHTKCGDLQDGIKAFHEITEKNLVSWNSVVVGCAHHGRGELAVAFFTKMVKASHHPDGITFTALLNACSHSGNLQRGRRFFERLQSCDRVETKHEHYACMIDILSRNGKLAEAVEVARSMSVEPDVTMLLTLLSGCRAHLNVQVAETVAEWIFEIDPHCSGACVLLSGLYADVGRWADSERIRRRMKKKQQPGQSWII